MAITGATRQSHGGAIVWQDGRLPVVAQRATLWPRLPVIAAENRFSGAGLTVRRRLG